MLAFIKRHSRVMFCSAAFAVCLVAVLCFSACQNTAAKNPRTGTVSVKASKQSDYPVLPGQGLVDSLPVNLKDLVTHAPLIVDATVTEVQPEQARTFKTEKGSADEKLYGSGFSCTIRPVKLKINNTLKGNAKSQSITMYVTPVALDCAPTFKRGDRLIFMLGGYPGGGYCAVALQEAYFYIAADSKVYPAVLTKELKNISGQSLESFEKDIKDLMTGKK